jgi:hypothetical protein
MTRLTIIAQVQEGILVANQSWFDLIGRRADRIGHGHGLRGWHAWPLKGALVACRDADDRC